MKIENYEWNALMSMFETCNGNSKMAKALLEAWLDENYYAKVYKEAWLQFCDEYDIEDDHWYDDDGYDAGDLIYDGY